MGIRSLAGPLRRAVFLDRDGLLNRPVVRDGKPYAPATLAQFHLLPDALEAVAALRQRGFWLCVVTNQPDVARGTQERATVEAMHALLLRASQVHQIYVCYHDDVDQCQCRKPRPGLLLAAAAEHNISLDTSYMIGDRWRDIDCGHAAKCTTILVDRGYREPLRMQPHFRVADLVAATRIIS